MKIIINGVYKNIQIKNSWWWYCLGSTYSLIHVGGEFFRSDEPSAVMGFLHCHKTKDGFDFNYLDNYYCQYAACRLKLPDKFKKLEKKYETMGKLNLI